MASAWQPYIDSSLLGSGNVDRAAIWDIEGKGCWVKSPGFDVKPQEMQTVVALFNDPAKAFEGGFKVLGEKYMTIKAEPESLYGKKGKAGIIIVKTKLAILVATHPETVLSNSAANTVETLAAYLKGVGY